MNDPVKNNVTVMIAFRSDLFRKGIKVAFEKKETIEFIGEANNGEELLWLMEKKQPDIVMLDMYMPIVDGLQSLKIIKVRYPSVKVIMLTIFSDPEIIIRCLELGANGYITIDAGSDEVYEGLMAVLGPGIYLGKTARQSLNPRFKTAAERHERIIKDLANNISIEKIADELNLSVRTVQATIHMLKKNAQVNSIEELTIEVRKKGSIES